jgi:hypothetical protein
MMQGVAQAPIIAPRRKILAARGKGVRDAPPGYAAIAIRSNGVVNIVRIGSPGSSSTPVIKVG